MGAAVLSSVGSAGAGNASNGRLLIIEAHRHINGRAFAKATIEGFLSASTTRIRLNTALKM